jgi:hypothetical protein
MEIAVDGWRASAAEWDAVRAVPANRLPALTPEQREVARKLGIPEPDYARSALAGERTREALLRKTERLARLLEHRMQALGLSGSIKRVMLRTVEHRFDVEIESGGHMVPLRIEENLVDDYFDGGSLDAEEKLGRILDRALRVVKQ